MEKPLKRPFDYPKRYELEKHTRIMPHNLRPLGIYTLRMMWPPDVRPPFASEFLTCIISSTERDDGYFDVSFVMHPGNEPESADSIFNPNGFMIIPNDGEDPALAEFPEEIEMAYFVGSLDPYDLEFAELVAKAKELTPA